ncbi:mucin-22 [Nothobranchius furzeri]|uniref:mucin-22 n=1 Tax=Nothobranchius furzeri TaxID=105023 RepID=UPI003904ABB3
MRLTILLVFVLGSCVTADLPHEAVKEKKSTTLSCGRPGGDIVTWSMERNGIKEYILTNDGSTTIKHIKDPNKLYDSQHDKSLYIMKVEVSDSGRYFCNNESAVELTVIPSGTRTQTVKEGKDTTIKCLNASEGYKPSWSREIAGRPEHIRSAVPPGGEKLKITQVQLSDFGLYFCNGKPAVYLKVTQNNKHQGGKRTTTSTTPATTERSTTYLTSASTAGTTSTAKTTMKTEKTATTKPTPLMTQPSSTVTATTTAASSTSKALYFSLAAGICGFIFLIIIIVFVTWRCRLKKHEADKQFHAYDEVSDGIELQYTYDVSNQDDHTYSTIADLPVNKCETDSPYSLAGPATCYLNNKDSMGDKTYFLLEKPKAPEEL